jgi:hypothetical protein
MSVVMAPIKRKVGRPARVDIRKSVPTFFPASLRELVKRQAEAAGLPMSDWLDVKILEWLALHQRKAVYIGKTHSRMDSSGTTWVAVQVVLMHDTFERVQQYAQEFDVSVAGIVYTIAKGLIDAPQ